MKDGAVELDMVCNIGKVLSKDWGYVSKDIKTVVDIAHQKAAAKCEGDLRELLPRRRAQIELCKICGDGKMPTG